MTEGMQKFTGMIINDSTRATRCKHLRSLYRWLGWKGLTDLSVTDCDLIAYKDYLTIVRKLRQSTIASYFQTIKKYYAWLNDNGVISSNPAQGIEVKRRNIVRVYLTNSQIRNLAG